MLAMKVTRRVLAEIICWRVGHVLCGVEVGVYPNFEIPEEVNRGPYSEAGMSSELTIIKVTTSRGLASIQVRISDNHVVSGPASRRAQLLWQSLMVPLSRWTCPDSNRNPADNATVAL